ncbi:[NiFe] hydrogenase metallocenter assembly protein HypF [hydrothermal vent metagenome]|uniref:Carbamoyl phosphate-converting enzyme HypF n=1 Tax=hydrothermal vent metagenome TaxID=652676 RepID=A0A3B1BVF3_9ZZZZ
MTCCDPLLKRKKITVAGIVQGVGFRPFVYNLAIKLDLSGFVTNNVSGVFIEIEGEEETVALFEKELKEHAPPLAHITKIESKPTPMLGTSGFAIRKSDGTGEKTALITPDCDVCAECVKELFDKADRRYRYPFINCTNCGPRFSIVNDVPYDRQYTSMAEFKMCKECEAEYKNPADRRYHAQPIACPVCGPAVKLFNEQFDDLNCKNPIEKTAKLIDDGMIVAVKGIGGYHLVADATNETAVKRLREKKKRDEKPFAVMTKEIDVLKTFAHVGVREEALIKSVSRPITLVRKKSDATLKGVAPGNKYIGAMLPYTPIHHLLMSEVKSDALIMTSANISDEPIVFTEDEARIKLKGIADAYLVHNREILNRADDSIERMMKHGPVVLRRSRGYTPAPIMLSREHPKILAVGGEMKNTFCFTKGNLAFLSQHIGDLKYESVYDSFISWIERFHKLLDIKKPDAIAYDLHPSYLSHKYALEQKDVPLFGIQHHHAHMVSCMAENHVEQDGIGIIFDGTGYGDDGQIWGSEFLVGGVDGYTRMATIKPIPLPGGERAIREPYRMALAVLLELYGDDLPNLDIEWLRDIDENTFSNIRKMTEQKINTPMSHGMGRVFDTAGALLDIKPVASFEGQTAMELEMACAENITDSYPVVIDESRQPVTLDFYPLFRQMINDRMNNVEVPVIAAKFHNSVAKGAFAVAKKIRGISGIDHVFMSGGVFQNAYLSDKLGEMLENGGFTVFRHSRVPPNDGGLSLGQAVITARRFEKMKREESLHVRRGADESY